MLLSSKVKGMEEGPGGASGGGGVHDGDPASLLEHLERALVILRTYLETRAGSLSRDLVDTGELSQHKITMNLCVTIAFLHRCSFD